MFDFEAHEILDVPRQDLRAELATCRAGRIINQRFARRPIAGAGWQADGNDRAAEKWRVVPAGGVLFSAGRRPMELNYGVIFRDISIRQREASRIRYLAEYDELTGLANRHSLVTYLREKIAGRSPVGRNHPPRYRSRRF